MTKSELERLAILAEECGEVVQIVGKIIRHGYESYNPFDKDKTTNRKLLEKELGDIEFICKLMLKQGDLNRFNISTHEAKKAVNIEQYLHHQNID